MTDVFLQGAHGAPDMPLPEGSLIKFVVQSPDDPKQQREMTAYVSDGSLWIVANDGALVRPWSINLVRITPR